jgi:hypothetical protein
VEGLVPVFASRGTKYNRGMSERPTRQRGPVTAFSESPRFRRWVILGLLLLPMLYVAGFGPACWFSAVPRRGPGDDVPRAWMRFYFPMGALVHRTQSQDNKRLLWWITWGSASSSPPTPADGTGTGSRHRDGAILPAKAPWPIDARFPGWR